MVVNIGIHIVYCISVRYELFKGVSGFCARIISASTDEITAEFARLRGRKKLENAVTDISSSKVA